MLEDNPIDWKAKYHRMGRFAAVSSLFCLCIGGITGKYVGQDNKKENHVNVVKPIAKDSIQHNIPR